MFKVTPNPPDTDPASPNENLDSKKLHEAADRTLDFHLNTPADIKATPRAPGTMFIVNPQLDTETLLAHACESLASANVMAMDLADHMDGRWINSIRPSRTQAWSWLASEGGLKPCTAHEDAFAGKPGSYGIQRFSTVLKSTGDPGARPAREEAGTASFFVDCKTAIAGNRHSSGCTAQPEDLSVLLVPGRCKTVDTACDYCGPSEQSSCNHNRQHCSAVMATTLLIA